MDLVLHREIIVKVLVMCGDESLILKIGEYKDHPEKSHQFDLPGGFIEPGETECEGAVRELFEETGIEFREQKLELIFAETVYIDDEQKVVTKLLYRAILGQKPSVRLSWEHESYEWIKINQLTLLELRSFYRRAVDFMANSGVI